MKFSTKLLGLSLILFSSASAQFKKGDVELSLSGTAGSLTTNSKYSSSSYYSYNFDHSESLNFIYLAFTCGYFLTDGLSLEPEIGLFAVEKSYPAQSFLGNLSYTAMVPDSKVALFVRGGYGISNSFHLPLWGMIPLRYSDKFDITIINAGAGVKYLFTQTVALRIELNYRRQSYSHEETYSLYSQTEKYELAHSTVAALFGFSVLL